MGGAFVLTIAASGGTILLSLITGVLTARFLGTEGRGHVATISAWTLTFAWASSLGFANAMVYSFSRAKATRGQVLAAVLLSVPILGLLGTLLAQVALPLGFAAQSEDAIAMARLFFCGIVFVLGVESIWALLMAYHEFRALNAVRTLQPLLYAITLVALLVFDAFTPFDVLLAQAGSYAVTFLLAAVILIRKNGVERVPGRLVKEGMSYGLRLQGVSFGQLVTNRLDLLMLPAFVTAAELGFYSIAVNVASMVMSLFGNLAMVVFPMAARADGDQATDVVGRGLRLTLLGGAATVIPLALLSPQLISLVYGHDFVSAVPALLCLLPGVVLWSATSILGAALQAIGRPGTASLAQLAGMVITVIGLVALLPRYGIVGASLTSSLAYAGAFGLTLFALRRATGFRLRDVMSPRLINEDLGWLRERARNLMAKGRRKEDS